MSLTRGTTASIDPFRRAINDVFQSMEREMVAPFGFATRFPLARTFPAIIDSGVEEGTFNMQLDFHETDTGYEMTADLPGMNKDDITVDVDNESGVLTVSGERRNMREEKGDGTEGERKYHFVERSYGKTTRSVRLPETADASKAKAGYVDGVLTLTFPKRESAASRRLKIPVGGSHGDGTVSIGQGGPPAAGAMES